MTHFVGHAALWRAMRVTAVALAAGLAACEVPSAELPEWLLRQELRIGNESSPDYSLTEFGEMAVGPDGAMFVPQFADGNIRVFDAGGRFLRSVGRRGEGPGEFAAVLGMGIHHDSLWVSDRSRITFFSLAGEFLGSVTSRYDPGGPQLVPGAVLQIMADGSFATVPSFVPTLDRDAWPAGIPIQRFDQHGSILAVMAMLDPSPIKLFSGPGDRPLLAMVPFQPLFLHAFAPDGRSVVVIDQAAATSAGPATFRFLRLGPDGDTLADRNVPYSPVPVPPSVRDSVIDAMSAGNVPRDVAAARLRAAPIPSHFPPIASAVIADDGTVWLALQATTPPRWLVVDSTGTAVAQVVGDPSLHIMVIRGGDVWGGLRNELDVPFVVRYRIQR